MAKQYVNKVIVNQETVIDLSNDTVRSDKMISGYTAHDSSGAPITGTLTDKDINDVVIQGNHIIIPPGMYSNGIDIALKDWEWDPLSLESSMITNAVEVESIVEQPEVK